MLGRSCKQLLTRQPKAAAAVLLVAVGGAALAAHSPPAKKLYRESRFFFKRAMAYRTFAASQNGLVDSLVEASKRGLAGVGMQRALGRTLFDRPPPPSHIPMLFPLHPPPACCSSV